MDGYRAPLSDIRFTLEHVAPLASLVEEPGFEHADAATVGGLLEEAGRVGRRADQPRG